MNFGDHLELLEAKENQGKQVDFPPTCRLRLNGFIGFILRNIILTALLILFPTAMVSGYFVVGKYPDIRQYEKKPDQFVKKAFYLIAEVFKKDIHQAELNSTAKQEMERALQ